MLLALFAAAIVSATPGSTGSRDRPLLFASRADCNLVDAVIGGVLGGVGSAGFTLSWVLVAVACCLHPTFGP